MKLPLDLRGKEYGGGIEAVEGPEERGPSVHIEGDETLGIPDEGEMTVKFRIRRREECLRGKEREHEVCLELLEITKMKDESPKPPATSGTEGGKALDQLRAAMEK